jgi:PAS domain S-box-containing protein
MRRRFRLPIAIGLVALAGLGLKLWVDHRRLPQITYRMGYEDNPPNMVVGADGKLSGLAIETVREAARRANIRLRWIRYEGSGSPLVEGIVDVWPLMADLPQRHREIHLTDPWLQTRYMFLYRAGQQSPESGFRGRIGRYSQPLHGLLIKQHYPQATSKSYPSREDLVQGLCHGEVDAAFLEQRAVLRFLSESESAAAPCALQSSPVAGVFVRFSAASSKGAAAVADRIREQIGEMARDGTLAMYLARYDSSGVHDATGAFELAEAELRARWLAIVALSLAVALTVLLWQNRRIGAARGLAEQSFEYLIASETRFRALLEHSADLIAVIGSDGVLSYVSPSCAKVLGWQNAELVYKNLYDLLHPDDRDDFVAAITSLPEPADLPSRVRMRLLHRQKHYRTFQALVRRLPKGHGLDTVLINARDVTVEARLQEQLQQSQKMEAVGRLAGGIAHDFNNLLTVINGYSGMLIKHTPPSDPNVEDLTEILKAGQRAAGLTQQLLAFSRRQVIAPRHVDLNASVAEMLEMLRRVMREDVSVETALDPALGTVLVDPDQIHQVIMNLAINGRDAMPHGGKLLLETQNVELGPGYVNEHPEVVPGRYVLLAVTDTGTGIDPAALQSIFEPFFTTKEKGHGTGLGLATVHGIVRQSSGWIWAYSEPGKGTTFKIYFPRTEAPPDSAATTEAAAPLTRLAGRTILVVEDQNEVRLLMQDVLDEQGYHVLTAGSAEDAMRIAVEYSGSIDLLLTDVVLPGMTGPQLAECLRPLKAGLRVLYTSGYTENVVVHRGVLEAGFQYLPKPFSPEALALKVHEILR